MINFSDLDDENRSYEKVINYLTKDLQEEKHSLQENKNKEEIEFPKLLSWKYVTELAVNNFNERYSHLNESEQNLVKILMSNESYKINYLEDLKQENLSLINNFLSNTVDSETTENLNKFKNKIEKLNNLNLDESIINLYELNINLKD